MFQLHLIEDEHIEPLADAVMNVLEQVGILCQNEELLRALEGAGAKVDYSAERAWFPRNMVAEFVEGLRASGGERIGLATYGEKEDAPEQAGQSTFPKVALPTLGVQIAQFYYDWEAQEKRPGNRDDFITLTKLAQTLHPEVEAGHALLLTDVPPMVEPLEAAMLLAEYAEKPGVAFAWHVDQVDYLKEMGDILGIENWFTWGALCFAHPLRLDRDVADKFLRRLQEGVPSGMAGMPIAGFTTPATVEGFIAVSAAEHVAVWMTARAVNPQAQLSGSMWGGSIDMRTGEVSYCAFDAMYYAFAAVEFMRRWCGVIVPVGGGEYCAAKVPGLYAALEKAYKAMMIAAFTGQHPDIGQGMLDDGKILAPVQLLLERDLSVGVQQLAREVAPTPENIGMPGIVEVDLGLQMDHLRSEHTLKHFRSALWLPEFIARAGYEGAEQDQEVLDKAQAQVNALLAEYERPRGREDQLAEMRKVVERASRELG